MSRIVIGPLFSGIRHYALQFWDRYTLLVCIRYLWFAALTRPWCRVKIMVPRSSWGVFRQPANASNRQFLFRWPSRWTVWNRKIWDCPRELGRFVNVAWLRLAIYISHNFFYNFLIPFGYHSCVLNFFQILIRVCVWLIPNFFWKILGQTSRWRSWRCRWSVRRHHHWNVRRTDKRKRKIIDTHAK